MLGFNSNATNWPLDFCKRNVLIFLFLVSLAAFVSRKKNHLGRTCSHVHGARVLEESASVMALD